MMGCAKIVDNTPTDRPWSGRVVAERSEFPSNT